MDVSASNQKISWFRREEESETLDLTPQFQRRPVWTDEQSSYLIDTILSGLPIPEIYIRSSSTPKGKARYKVIERQTDPPDAGRRVYKRAIHSPCWRSSR